MRGAKLLRVEYISETQYVVCLTGVNPHCRWAWKLGSARVNAREYAETRLQLKRDIHAMSPGRMHQPGDQAHPVRHITVPQVPSPRQEDDPTSTARIRDPNPDKPNTGGEGQTLKGHSTTLDREE